MYLSDCAGEPRRRLQHSSRLSDVRAAGVTIGMSLGAARKAIDSRGQNGARDGEAQNTRQKAFMWHFLTHPTDKLYLYLNRLKRPLSSCFVF